MTILTSLLLILPALSFADPGRQSSMNGIRFKDYDGFERKWPQVTVRFREDTKEMRFTYANEKAMKALKENSRDYPDGAVFGKIGTITADDPLFTSSKVPSGASRFQLMVRDKAKYASTGGWGYALFDSAGLTFAGPTPADASQSCYACHKLAADRGEVFSQMINFKKPDLSPPSFLNQKLRYSDKKVSDLPDWIRGLLAPSEKQVRFLEGDLRKNLFQGTIDEIRPSLLAEASRTGQAVLLLSQDQTQMSLAMPAGRGRNAPLEACKEGQTSFAVHYTVQPKDDTGKHVVTGYFVCR